MTGLLSLLAAAAFAQGRMLTTEDVKKEGVTPVLQQSLDDKFEIAGGTLAGAAYLVSSATISGTLAVNNTAYVNNSLIVRSAGNDIVLSTATTSNSLRIEGLTGDISIAGKAYGLWQFISSSTLTNATSVSYSGLSSSQSYRLDAVFVWGGTSGAPHVRFNNESTATYQWTSNDLDDTPAQGVAGTSTGAGCEMSNVTVPAANVVMFTFVFSTNPGQSKQVVATYQSVRRGASRVTVDQGGCYYAISSDFNRVDIVASAGNMTGYSILSILRQ